jgi:hypothetical protein
MEKKMKRKEFLDALLHVKPGISSKGIVEAMTYFYFTGTHVCSYNDRISIQFPLKTDFTAFVNANDLFKVISKINVPEISFKKDGDSLKMKTVKSLMSFQTITDDEVVKRIQNVDESYKTAKLHKTLPKLFLKAIKMCYPIASRNESDLTLTCLYINKKDVVATDNIRIAHYKIDSDMPELLITASEIKNLLDIEPIKYAITGNWIHFVNVKGCVFSIRLTKGDYPDMLQYLSVKGTKILLPEELIDGIDVTSVFTDATDNSINVSIDNGICRLYKESEAGKSDYRMKVDYKGGKISFDIQPELLKEILSYKTDITIDADKALIVSENFTLCTSLFVE